MTTTTLQAEIYAFFFDQKGRMGGLGLQGTKITRIKKRWRIIWAQDLEEKKARRVAT